MADLSGENDPPPDLPRGWVPGFVAAVCAGLARSVISHWREQRAARSAVGRIGVVASLPLRAVVAAVLAALAVALGGIAAVESVVFEGPSLVAAAYRRWALREGRDE